MYVCLLCLFEVWDRYSNSVPTFLQITNITEITGDASLPTQTLWTGQNHQDACMTKCEKMSKNCVFFLYVNSANRCYFYGSTQQVKNYSKLIGVTLYVDWPRSKVLAA